LVKVKYAALGIHDGFGHIAQFITAGIDSTVHAKIGPLLVGQGLLGLLFHRGKSLIINDIAAHPEAVGFPEHHPPMQRLLGVPIFSKGKLMGALYLTDKLDGSDFTETDRWLVKMLGLQAVIAIENAKLYEQEQHLAILEERERFARDLHDGIIQSIYAVGLTLDQVKLDMPDATETTTRQIDLTLRSLADVTQELRNYIFDLRPHALIYQGLKIRLENLIKELYVNTLLPIQAEIPPDIDNYLSDTQARQIFHICHEALANAARHAKAKHINLGLKLEGEMIRMWVKDDGIGFEKETQIEPGHHGLANMYTRAAEIGGRLKIESTPQQGTCATLVFRCNNPPLTEQA
jgi:signal transduction histidine kinase